ncbi:MAG: hypothetical protein FGF48_06365 [Candidatus Brockarchaeota archaeon]|nr:hypothetical protein [Candidatus Brockarchaeota archaeon]MBO3842025.1 hypothetical protein [Candidatus Brockarchaeota archaeon]
MTSAIEVYRIIVYVSYWWDEGDGRGFAPLLMSSTASTTMTNTVTHARKGLKLAVPF